MCGIIAVVRRRSDRVPPSPGALADLLAAAAADMEPTIVELPARLESAAAGLVRVDTELRGVPGVTALVADPAGAASMV